MAQPTADVTDERLREAKQVFGDRRLIHQRGGKNEQWNGKQREAVETVDYLLDGESEVRSFYGHIAARRTTLSPTLLRPRGTRWPNCFSSDSDAESAHQAFALTGAAVALLRYHLSARRGDPQVEATHWIL